LVSERLDLVSDAPVRRRLDLPKFLTLSFSHPPHFFHSFVPADSVASVHSHYKYLAADGAGGRTGQLVERPFG
jgi:hypothetical protein